MDTKDVTTIPTVKEVDMSIRDKKIVPDTRVFSLRDVSKERGRKRMEELEVAGEITVYRTPTGRRWLTISDAERLAAAL
jgi:hypothetical protein